MTAHLSSAGSLRHGDVSSSLIFSSSRRRPPVSSLVSEKDAAQAAAIAVCARCGKDVPWMCRTPWPPLRGGEGAGPVERLRRGQSRCCQVESGVWKVESGAEKASLPGGRRASLTGVD